MAVTVQGAPHPAADEGQYEHQEEGDEIIGRVSRAIGEARDRIGEVEHVCADPGDEVVKGPEIPIREAIGEGDHAIGIEKNIEQEKKEEETEGHLFGQGPTDGRGYLFHVTRFVKR